MEAEILGFIQFFFRRLKLIFFILAFFFILASILAILYKVQNNFFPKPYRQLIYVESQKYAFDPLWIASIIAVESSYKEDAVSSSGACGLMQLMPDTAIDVSKKMGRINEKVDLFDKTTNVQFGLYYLNWLKSQYKEPRLALMSYNAGPQKVSKWLTKYPDLSVNQILHKVAFNETKRYVWKIELIYMLLKISNFSFPLF